MFDFGITLIVRMDPPTFIQAGWFVLYNSGLSSMFWDDARR